MSLREEILDAVRAHHATGHAPTLPELSKELGQQVFNVSVELVGLHRDGTLTIGRPTDDA